jgi:hypothetical protein
MINEILILPLKVEYLLSLIEANINDNIITIVAIENFKKFVFLVKRIIVNISLIILGDKGYRKVILITKLNKIFNNGESIFEIIYKQPRITDD